MHLPFYVTFLGIIHYNFVKWCAMFFLYVQYALLVLQFQAAPTHEWKSTCDVNLIWDGKGDSLQAVKPETTSIVGDHHNQANLGLIIRWSSNLGLVLTWFSSLTHCLCPVEHPQHPYQPPILTAPNKSTFQSGLLRNSQASAPIHYSCQYYLCMHPLWDILNTYNNICFFSPSKLKLLIPNNMDAEQSPSNHSPVSVI